MCICVAFQFLREAYERNGAGLLQEHLVTGQGEVELESRLRLDIRKKRVTVRVVRCWNRLLREVVSSSFLEVFNARLDGALSSLL